MNKVAVARVANILKNSKNFFFATTDGKRPFVRPYNAVVEYDGRLYFYTNNRTHAYKQIAENPFIEVCAMIGDDRWLRVDGKVVYDYDEKVLFYWHRRNKHECPCRVFKIKWRNCLRFGSCNK